MALSNNKNRGFQQRMFFIGSVLMIITFPLLFLLGDVKAAELLNAGKMHIQIANLTGIDCTLISQTTYHGWLDSPPPSSLLVSQLSSFDMEQILLYGPDEELNYQCGTTGNVKFEISQGWHCIQGQTPLLKVKESKGITAIASSITPSSVFYNSKGLINIELRLAAKFT